MTTPAVTALRRTLPAASLDYVVEEAYKDLIEGHPSVDNALVLPRAMGRQDFLRFARRLHRRRYDAILDFHGGPKASWLTFLSGAGLKIGYRTKYKNFIYDIKIDRAPEDGPIHSVVNHVNLVRALGIPVRDIPPVSVAPATAVEIERVERIFDRHRLGKTRPVVLHIGAGNAFRDWGRDNWRSLLTRLGNHSDIRVVLVGDSGDRDRAEDLHRGGPPHPLSLVGELTLRELRELIGRASLFVGPDSGPMHIAASTGTPQVILFGPTLPAHFAPWRSDALLLETDLDCRPCRQRRCLTDDFRCLNSITPQRVYEACLQKLGGKSP